MNIRWDYFVNQYETSRYIATSDGRDNRHIQFVREFASVVSVLQVRRIPFSLYIL
jgi:dynein heavy chain 1